MSARPDLGSEPGAEPDAAQLVRSERGRRSAVAGSSTTTAGTGVRSIRSTWRATNSRERDPVDAVVHDASCC